MVRNLPWSTANEDLVELFETTRQVELAEILFDGARSKGCSVVQFAQVPEAETAIDELGLFSTLCTIRADTSKIAEKLTPKQSTEGLVYYAMEIKVVLLFSLTELKAMIIIISRVLFRDYCDGARVP
ncbi:hypothetical protein DEU56DRAFT_939147 [Suillus clintonianus]|uniref:uncharacterized protein n=1 Tax=Suillus clintonianus TaxID=1904413 RepID=UPI001B869657|nr:uncharacterized protein DEU56DRAFT_939147 [Suillus clintonianus]KAG2142994.1 hypothetical protein DEU56DRAFT_939147 [Suillus clintonianus]